MRTDSGDQPAWVGVVIVMPDGTRMAWQVDDQNGAAPYVRVRADYLDTEPDPTLRAPVRPKPDGRVRLDIRITGVATYWSGGNAASPPNGQLAARRAIAAPRKEIEP